MNYIANKDGVLVEGTRCGFIPSLPASPRDEVEPLVDLIGKQLELPLKEAV